MLEMLAREQRGCTSARVLPVVPVVPAVVHQPLSRTASVLASAPLQVP